MAGRVVVSTLNDDTGVLSTLNGMTGIAKAWAKYDGPTATILSSFNISSITHTGGGGFSIVFANSLAANPCLFGGSSYNGSGSGNWLLIGSTSSTGASVQSVSTAAGNNNVAIYFAAFSS